MKKEEFRIRDPFVLPVKEEGRYYLYGTTDLEDGIRSGNRFCAYVSEDLVNFDGPFPVFDGSVGDFWADRDYWAAEVHRYNGKYYLFGSMKAENRPRATEIFVSDSPRGPFLPLSEKPQTPADWECLDGTLWIEDGKPYLVFCHEWLQCRNGEIWAEELTCDLSAPAGEPFLLFRASDHPAVTDLPGEDHVGCKVTDGPFLRRENGKIRMIWSSFTREKYQVLESEAETLRGEWKHLPPLYGFDGGHAMIFTTFAGERKISLHSPNQAGLERATFLPFPEK